jgi:hypothetical protein
MVYVIGVDENRPHHREAGGYSARRIRHMPRITLKETITKEIEIPMEALYRLIDNLSQEERERILDRLKGNVFELKPFEKDEVKSILADFEATDLYEDGFLKDLEKGLRKSSVYR